MPSAFEMDGGSLRWFFRNREIVRWQLATLDCSRRMVLLNFFDGEPFAALLQATVTDKQYACIKLWVLVLDTILIYWLPHLQECIRD